MRLLNIFKNIITEKIIVEEAIGKHLVVVDIQPEYKDGFGNMSFDLAEYINENYDKFNNLTFLYNGADTLGMISEYDYRYWWVEQGLDEDIAFNAHFYDKGYAFFRYCMDEGIDDDQISNLIRYMIENNIKDSRELDKEFWNGFVSKYGNEDIRDLLEFAIDMIYIPDLMDELENYNNIVLTGGGIDECLKEVEIALDVLDKDYLTWDKFIY